MRLTTLLAALVLTGCATNAATAPARDVPVNPDGTVALRVGDRAVAGELTVELRDIESDSRCAVDVVCVWAGDAAVALRLDRGGQRAGTTLHTTLEPKRVEYFGYDVALETVAPPNDSRRPTEKGEYVVTLRITRP
ncbi:MAG TPA: hypothetical protein VNA89_12405 [Gemmatimonadaceae bacterium]|nr:hypothetical protein [Gemmatimonadaceae bacterium]